MRKLLSLILLATLFLFGCKFCPSVQAAQTHPRPSKEQMKKEFEQRLNLSEKQKQQAKIIHQQGREQMKPIIYQIEIRHQEIEAVKRTKMTEKAKQERINQISEEIKELDKQAREIRKKNSQEFEKILNKKQKAELEKMKAEGRARFEKNHPPRPPFQGLGTPRFLMPKPLFPPPPPLDFFNNNND